MLGKEVNNNTLPGVFLPPLSYRDAKGRVDRFLHRMARKLSSLVLVAVGAGRVQSGNEVNGRGVSKKLILGYARLCPRGGMEVVEFQQRKLYERFSAVALLFVAWMLFAGQSSLPVLIVGFVISLLTVWLLPVEYLDDFSRNIFRSMIFFLLFMLYMLLEVFLASYKIAFVAFHPSVDLHSSVLTYDYVLESKIGIFLLSTVITLTPGTLVLDICTQKRRLYIHVLDRVSGDTDSTWETIELMENWLRRIF